MNAKKKAAVACALVACMAAASAACLIVGEESQNLYPVYQYYTVGGPYRSGVNVLTLAQDGSAGGLDHFKSFAEYRARLGNMTGPNNYYGRYYAQGGPQPMALSLASSSAESYGSDSSTTNIQVAGVDEGDIVKNDGKRAYVVSNDARSVYIVTVQPVSEAGVACQLEFDGDVEEMYLHGQKLVVIEQVWFVEEGYYPSSYVYSDDPYVAVKVFDVTNGSMPVLEKTESVKGILQTTRMIGSHVYVISTLSPGSVRNETDLPVPVECVHYLPGNDSSYTLTQFMAMSISEASQDPNVLSLLLGASGAVLMTQRSIYLTQRNYMWYAENGDGQDTTTIYKLSVQGKDISYVAHGKVPGHLLNKYSMDEEGEHFRAATSVGWMVSNNLYVLDKDMDVVGKLEGLAPGETIYSVRFMGSKAYLVTFKKVDPLFVIDLADPTAPKVLGSLKVPGYSNYLHPYDETHIIGIGKDTVDASGGDFAWYQGVKVSLFDVSNFSSPVEVDSMVIGRRGSESLALSDPHAFLFSRERNLLVLPIDRFDGNGSYYSHWYGAYAFNVSAEGGIEVMGTVEHYNSTWDSEMGRYGYGNPYSSGVKRAFYIGDVLYTVSDREVRGTSLSDFAQVCSVGL